MSDSDDDDASHQAELCAQDIEADQAFQRCERILHKVMHLRPELLAGIIVRLSDSIVKTKSGG